MHIPPYDNKNEAIVAAENALVPLNYFNIVKLKAGEGFSLCHPGIRDLHRPGDGHGRCDGGRFLGHGSWRARHRCLGRRTRRRLRPDRCTGASSPAVRTRPKSLSPALSSTRSMSHLPSARLNSTSSNTARTTPRPTARSNISSAQKHHGKVGRLLVSELYTVGAGRLVRLSQPQARHRPPARRNPP